MRTVIITLVALAAYGQQITVNNVAPSAKQGNGTKFQLAGLISGSAGTLLCLDGFGNTTTQFCAGGGGAVTSVGLSMPATMFSVTGSPITSSGTFNVALTAQAANFFLAGPVSSTPTTPSFRQIVSNDVPPTNLSSSGNGGVSGILFPVNGGLGFNSTSVTKGGLIVGTAPSTFGLQTIGANGTFLKADSTSPTGVSWAVVSGSGSVTSVATASPITGGTITTTGTIGCATCVTSASSLALNQLVIGQGSQATATLGSLGTSTTVLHGNASGAPAFSAINLATDVSGLLGPVNGGIGIDLSGGTKGVIITGTGSGTYGVLSPGSNGLFLTTDSTQASGLKWVTVSGTGTVTSIATTSPIGGGTITTSGTITCVTCVTSAFSLASNQFMIGGGGQASSTASNLFYSSGNVGLGAAPLTFSGGFLNFGVNIAGNTAGVISISSGAASASNNGGLFEVNTNLSTVGDNRLGLLAFGRNTDVTSNHLSSFFQIYVNNDGTLINPLTIPPFGTSFFNYPVVVNGTVTSSSGGFIYPDFTQRATAPAKIAELSDYNFSAITPSGCTGCGSGGSATITLPRAPLGMSASNPIYTLYISGGTGAAEVVPVTGGTCTPLATSCTVIVTLNHAHSGFTVLPATAGLQECVFANQGGTCHVSTGQYTVYGPMTNAGVGNKIVGDGMESSLFVAQGDGVGVINIENAGWTIEDVGFVSTVQQTTGGYAVRMGQVNPVFFTHFNRIACGPSFFHGMAGMYDCLVAASGSGTHGSSQWWVTNSKFNNWYHDALIANADNGTSDGVGPIVDNNIFFIYSIGGHTANSCLDIIATGVITFSNNFCAGNSDGPNYVNYGVLLQSTASTGLRIVHNDFQAITTATILMSGSWNSVEIADNTIDQPGFMTSGYGILITNGAGSGVTQGTISGNQIQGPGGSNTFRGIDTEGATSNFTMTGNSFTLCDTGYYLNQSGTITVGPSNMSSVTTPINSPAGVSTFNLTAPVTFAQLPTAANGSQLYVTNANSTCTAGGGTGRTCFRENGAWTH